MENMKMKRKHDKKIWPSPTGTWTPDFWTSSRPRFGFWGRLDQSSSRFLKNLDLFLVDNSKIIIYSLNLRNSNGPEGETHRKWQDLLQLCKNLLCFFPNSLSVPLPLCFTIAMTLLSRGVSQSDGSNFLFNDTAL